ncbi:MAG: aminopeptidase P family protein [Rikenellaceae bacterium]|nr:aminopeptidase P family protein [Rikenellaceae bacterium]
MDRKDIVASIVGLLRREKLSAFVIPSGDCHGSEYVADHWKCREYVSGFDGSAGTLAVTVDGAALWTDSRYWLQAEAQLEGSGITLMREGADGVPSMAEWLGSKFAHGRVGVDASLYTVSAMQTLMRSLAPLEVVATGDIFDELWPGRPALPQAPVTLLDDEYSGLRASGKLRRVRRELGLANGAVYPVSALDEIAWLLNIRGGDIDYNPVTVSYLLVSEDKAVLFIDGDKLSVPVVHRLQAEGVEIRDYGDFDAALSQCRDRRVVFNPSSLSWRHYELLRLGGAVLEAESDPSGVATSMKAVKNPIEIEGFRRAMIEDGVALVRFYMWLEEQLHLGRRPTEWQAGERLGEFRAESPLFRSDSFAPVVGYKSNGAIVHYEAPRKGCKRVGMDGFLLIDSGGQYLCGTTDITRTVHFGTPTEQEKRDFTLVLKGHIDLARAVFPEGTRGSQLDFLARRHLCAESLNYLHGTGHGVGHYLCVHEGPQSIRMNENPVTLKAGMVITDEPGLYRPRKWGIRSENVLLCVEHSSGPFGRYLAFEPLTLFPFDVRSIVLDMLTVEQRRYLNRYHETVYDLLSPKLTAKEKLWLMGKTKSI